MVLVIAPMGLSPPVVTEYIDHLVDGLGEPVRKVLILATRDPEVLASAKTAQAALNHRYPKIRVEIEVLPHDDIDTQEKFQQLASAIAKVFKKIRGEPRKLLLISGGRKGLAVLLTTIASFTGVEAVHHVIMKDVKAFNIELERARKEIEEVGKAENPLQAYQQHLDKLNPIMYPHRSQYEVIELPHLPTPPQQALKIAQLLTKTTPIKNLDLPANQLHTLEEANLIKTTANNIHPTEKGKQLAQLIKQILT